MRRVFWILVCVWPLLNKAQGIPPIGQWREHLPWNSASYLAIDGDRVICATPYALFYYDQKERSFQRWSRMNGLSETGTRAIGYDASSKSTIIAYPSGNLDVIKGDKVINIPDIRISTVPGDKTINNITINAGKAYLSTGLGVIVVDLSRYLINDTWRIGIGGKESRVNDLLFTATQRMAATEEGLRISAINTDPSDFRNWSTLGTGNIDEVEASANMVFARKGDSVFRLNNGWVFLNRISNITGMDIINGALMILSASGRLTELNADGSIARTITPTGVRVPVKVVAQANTLWIADRQNGLCTWNGTVLEKIVPNSPNGITTGAMRFSGNDLWVASGGVDRNRNRLQNTNGIYRFNESEQWKTYDRFNTSQLDSVLDFTAVAAGPSSVFFGSYGGGLAELRNGKDWFIYKQNTTLQSGFRISGLALDDKGDLWLSNDGAASNIQVLKKDGSWKAFRIPFTHTDNAVADIVIDQLDQKWIVSPKGNGLFVMNSGQNVDNTGDDQWRYYRFGRGQGNLPSNNVYSVAVDRDGFIWVGTDKGIGVINCVDKATSSVCDAIWPIIQQNGFAGYLFQNEEVRAIAVDGANRKWVGTRNGLWLVSADGEQIIHQFTSINSPLLANEIFALSIDPITGELFIATANGICSFRSTATEPVVDKKQVLVFPNPVPPGFAGSIGIRGLPENALVKITELDGRLVFQTRSLGGQAIWNGRDAKGNKVSSGVYLVLVSDEQNAFKLATKIFFVR